MPVAWIDVFQTDTAGLRVGGFSVKVFEPRNLQTRPSKQVQFLLGSSRHPCFENRSTPRYLEVPKAVQATA